MNLFQLTFKQMRQRALSTWLTFLSVMLGVALAIAILLLYREGDKLFTQSDFGFDVVVGSKTGGKLNTVLSAVYQLGSPPTPISYSIYTGLTKNPDVRWALPWAVGDNYEGFRVIGTSPAILGFDEELKPLPPGKIFEYRQNRHFDLASGKVFHPRKFEAVIGAAVAPQTDLRLGSKFKASHGSEKSENKDEHDEAWTVVGILKPTHTAMDRLIFIPAISAMAVPAHAEVIADIASLQEKADPHAGQEHDEHDAEHHHEHIYDLSPDGVIELHLPAEQWLLSAVFVRSIGGRSQNLIFEINNLPYATAVNPAWEMRQFFEGFMKGSRLLLLCISALVTVVAAVGILVSIYNSVAARLREIAIIRALGATRLRVVAMICLEAGMIGLVGGVAGLLAGHALGAVGNVFFRAYVGEEINYLHVGGEELVYVAIVVIIAVVAGVVPALKAYRTPVATNLN